MDLWASDSEDLGGHRRVYGFRSLTHPHPNCTQDARANFTFADEDSPLLVFRFDAPVSALSTLTEMLNLA